MCFKIQLTADIGRQLSHETYLIEATQYISTDLFCLASQGLLQPST